MSRRRDSAADGQGLRADRRVGGAGRGGQAPTSGGHVGARGVAGARGSGSANRRDFLFLREVERDLPRDLFGVPIRPGAGKPGRPMHLPTPATRALVIQLRQAGCNQLEIGAALGISGPTLRLNYAAELKSASQTWRRRAGKSSPRPSGAQSKE